MILTPHERGPVVTRVAMAVDVPLVEPDESMEEEEVLACSFEPPGRGVNVSGVEAFRGRQFWSCDAASSYALVHLVKSHDQ